MREHKPLASALLGALILAAYGVVAALQPISEFGRVYAAYAGVFIALALVWGVVVDGFRPDRWAADGISPRRRERAGSLARRACARLSAPRYSFFLPAR